MQKMAGGCEENEHENERILWWIIVELNIEVEPLITMARTHTQRNCCTDDSRRPNCGRREEWTVMLTFANCMDGLMRCIVWRSSRTLRLCSSTQMYAVWCLLCDWNTVQNWMELFLTYVCSRHGWSFIGLFSFPMSEVNLRKRFRNLIYRRRYT